MIPCAVLCGGLATRLKPISDDVPKIMLDVDGEPFIDYQIRLLHSKGIRDIVLCVGHLSWKIATWVQDGNAFGMRVKYSLDGESLVGTAQAVRQALPLLGDEFFVLYGDVYLDVDYEKVYEAFADSGKLALMAVHKGEPSNVWLVDGQIIDHYKTNPAPYYMRHMDYGLGVFKRGAFETFGDDLSEVYRGLLEREQLASLEVHEKFYEIGSFEGLEDTRREFKRRREWQLTHHQRL